MPRLVPDPNCWHPSAAMVCVGPSEHPRRLNGNCGQVPLELLLTSTGLCSITRLTYSKRTRETGPALIATPVSFVRKMWRSQAGRNSSCQVHTSERLMILEHPPQCQVHQKTGASTRIGAAACHLNGESLGELSCVSGPPRILSGLDPAPGTRLRPGTASAALRAGPLSPNRCLAGRPLSKLPTEN